MRLGETLAAAVKKLTKKRPAAQKAALPRKGEGTSSPSKGIASVLPQGSAKQAPAGGAAMPAGTAKRPASSPASVPKGKSGQGGSSAPVPKGTSAKKTTAQKTSGEAAPKPSRAALPRGSAKEAPQPGAAMPAGTAKQPASAAVPKGTADAPPGRIQTAQAKGSSQTIPKQSGAAMPAGSWQSLHRAETAGRKESATAGFSSRTGEIPLTGPPPDPARQLSELLRVQRRMNPGAETFGEEVL